VALANHDTAAGFDDLAEIAGHLMTKSAVLTEACHCAVLLAAVGGHDAGGTLTPTPKISNMIQALAPKRSDEAFSIWILPGGSW